MKILLTGDRGFVGRHISKAFRGDGHTVIGIEAEPQFDEWIGKFHRSKRYDFVLRNIDAIVHAGAISSNQYTDPDIFIWNSYATLVLAKYARDRYGADIPFVFFSTFQADVVEKNPNSGSWYGWSKVFAEACLKEVLPNATILRPGVMWGDETHKGNPKDRSVPFQLATHQLKYLYKHWGRDYIHVSDVAEAVKIAIRDTPRGVFNLSGEYWTNMDLAKLTDWNDYEVIDNRATPMKKKFSASICPEDVEGLLLMPNWRIQSDLQTEFRRIEDEYRSETTFA